MGFVAELVEVRERLTVLGQRFDPDTISATDAENVLDEARTISNAAHALTRSAAARAADVGATRDGERDRESWIGRKTGRSKTKARAEEKTEERLRHQPAVADAAKKGDLSPEQTEAIAAAVEANPAAEGELLAAAGRLSLPELQDRCRKARAAGDPDAEATYRRLRRARKLVMWGDIEGAFHLLGDSTGDDGTVIRGALDLLVEEVTEAAISNGQSTTRDSRQAYALDALVLLCQRYLDACDVAPDAPLAVERAATTGGTVTEGPTAAHAGVEPPNTGAEAPPSERTVVEPSGAGAEAEQSKPSQGRKRRRNRGRNARYLGIIRIDLAQLLPDGAEAGAGPMVEIAGVGRVPLDVARRLLGDGILKLVITKGVDVLNVTHLGRGPTTAQEIALLWSQPTCAVTSCPLPVYEVDHDRPWADHRVTELPNLNGYCKHDHYLKTYKGWALIDDGPWRVLVPPDDPRHPRHGGGGDPNAPP